ncbi:hypothetical protein Bca4012_002287 [Brassica carinata]|uniref:Uncharacterized protein n=2 Tax=Brassica TaxID=3705 RepID=A0A8S9NXJ9_BRACR|nr:hypothetical protein F2Q69_00001950 [Brassica cretica]KAG2332483.1 hypothetical protein Bca52824_003663 [Brassica carinata]
MRLSNFCCCRLSKEAKKDEAVRHALSVRAAVISGNCVPFFRLYKTAPNKNKGDRSLCGEDELQGSESYISELSSYNPNFILSPSVGLYWCFRPSTGEKESDGMEVCSEWLKPMVLASYLTVTEICFLIPRRQQRVSSYQNLKMQLLMENDI